MTIVLWPEAGTIDEGLTERAATSASVQTNLHVRAANLGSAVVTVHDRFATHMLGGAGHAGTRFGHAIRTGAALPGGKTTIVWSATPPFRAAFPADGAKITPGRTAEFFPVADAIATSVVATFCLANRTAIRSAAGGVVGTNAGGPIPGLLSGAADRSRGRRWPAGGLGIGPRHPGDGGATQPEQPLQDLPAVGARRE